jgi:molecular chaperone DnaK (HSP70)
MYIGEDFDNRLVEYVCDEFKKKHNKVGVSKDQPKP